MLFFLRLTSPPFLVGLMLLTGCAAPPVGLEVGGFQTMRLNDTPTCYCSESYPVPTLTVWATNPTDQGLNLPLNPKWFGTYRSRWWLVFQQDSAELFVLHHGAYLRPQTRQKLVLGFRESSFCTLLHRAHVPGACRAQVRALFQNATLVAVLDPRDARAATPGNGVVEQVAIAQHMGSRLVSEFDGH